MMNRVFDCAVVRKSVKVDEFVVAKDHLFFLDVRSIF